MAIIEKDGWDMKGRQRQRTPKSNHKSQRTRNIRQFEKEQRNARNRQVAAEKRKAHQEYLRLDAIMKRYDGIIRKMTGTKSEIEIIMDKLFNTTLKMVV